MFFFLPQVNPYFITIILYHVLNRKSHLHKYCMSTELGYLMSAMFGAFTTSGITAL